MESPLPAELAAGAAEPMLFFGSVDDASGRQACWAELKAELGERLQSTFGAWNVSALGALLLRHDLFLNIHKGCERGHAPVTFRAAWLLSAGKLVVSEHADVRDEAAYAGLIVFASQPEIGAAYAALRARPRAALKHEVFAAYQRRFAPLALFEAAGVYRDFSLTTTPLR